MPTIGRFTPLLLDRAKSPVRVVLFCSPGFTSQSTRNECKRPTFWHKAAKHSDNSQFQSLSKEKLCRSYLLCGYNPAILTQGLKQEEKIIGFGGVEHRVWRERDVLNLYYRFTPSAWGQGYATELARIAVSLARTYLPQWPVVARTRANNIPSIRTAERAGLIRRPDLDTEHMVFALGWTSTDTFYNSL